MNADLIMLTVVTLTAIAITWFVTTFNRCLRLRQHIRESWAGIDVELKRRHDLIPNLVQTVKGYAAHERAVLERVTELRDRAVGTRADAAALATAESELMRAVKQLFVAVENYPQLRADRHFLELQEQLAITEDRVAAARRFYNGNVRHWLILRDSFPSVLIDPFLRLHRDRCLLRAGQRCRTGGASRPVRLRLRHVRSDQTSIPPCGPGIRVISF